MRATVLALRILLLPLRAAALDASSAGFSLGGSWTTQEHGWSPDYQFISVVDGGIRNPAAGGFLWLGLAGSFSAVLEAMYTRKGFETTVTATNAQGQIIGETTFNHTGQYLSIPISAVYGFGSRDKGIYVFAGLSAEVLLNHDDDDLYNNMNPVTLGGQAGLWLRWERVGVNARYFSDITESYDPEPTFNLLSIRNYGVLVLATFAVWRR